MGRFFLRVIKLLFCYWTVIKALIIRYLPKYTYIRIVFLLKGWVEGKESGKKRSLTTLKLPMIIVNETDLSLL